jgi:Ca-activated chloride channel family protein
MKQLLPLCLAAFPMAAHAQEPPCRLALAMALDISSSVNEWEYDIQLLGLVEALRDPEIQEMILAIPGTQVQAMVYEWSGYVQQDLIVGWTRLSTVEEIDAFADRLSQHWRIYSDFPTAIGKALEKAIDEFDRLPVSCAYSVVDISGDGVGNDGPPAREMWPALAARGITVNALVIAGAEPDPVAHYRENVITGPGAFIVEARNGFEDYPALIRGKLLRELEPQIILSSPADHR